MLGVILKTAAAAAAVFSALLAYSLCIASKGGECVEYYGEIYLTCEEQGYPTPREQYEAERELIRHYVEQQILPKRSLTEYGQWRQANHPFEETAL